MVVGILQVELAIDGARSLKDKRRVVSSIKDRLHNQHQVSVAEIQPSNSYERAVLGIAMAASSVPYCQGVLDRVLNKIRTQRGCAISNHTTEILTGR